MSIDQGAILPPVLLQRRAIIYVRQSTQTQVMMNLESQRRQYDLVERHGGMGSLTSTSLTMTAFMILAARTIGCCWA